MDALLDTINTILAVSAFLFLYWLVMGGWGRIVDKYLPPAEDFDDLELDSEDCDHDWPFWSAVVIKNTDSGVVRYQYRYCKYCNQYEERIIVPTEELYE